jgi:acyl carrier protein
MDANTRARIRELLEEFWEERKILVEVTGTVEELVDEIDSLSAVDALIPIEDLLGIEIEESKVVRTGGYDSKQQFLDELSERIVKFAEKTL